MTRALNAFTRKSFAKTKKKKNKKKKLQMPELQLKSSSRNSFASIWRKIALILGLSILAE
jgi:predicted double-glycine peptidase